MKIFLQTYQLVKIVSDETKEPTNEWDTSGGNPHIDYCIRLLRFKYKTMAKDDALKVLAVATDPKNQYLEIDNRYGTLYSEQRLRLKAAGIKLLTPIGFANALFGSAKHILATVSILASLFGLLAKLI